MTEKNKVVNGALSYVTIEKGEWVRGSLNFSLMRGGGLRGWLRRMFRGRAVNSSGDWRNYIQGASLESEPRNGERHSLARVHHESQALYGFESMSCTTFGTLNAIELLMLAKGWFWDAQLYRITASSDGEAPQWSDRFISSLAGTTLNGNTPQKVAESVRRFGLVPERELPFDESIRDWESWNAGVTKELLARAKTAVRRIEFSHEWLWEERPAAERQKTILRDALRHSPVGVSVVAWIKEGELFVEHGEFQNHWTLLVGLTSSGDYVILDSYEPFLKTLRGDYRFKFAKRYSLRAKV